MNQMCKSADLASRWNLIKTSFIVSISLLLSNCQLTWGITQSWCLSMLRSVPSRSRHLRRNVIYRRLNIVASRRVFISTARPAISSKFPGQSRNLRSLLHTRSESKNEFLDDTIYALSTAPGRAGIAIIRISGSACLDVWYPPFTWRVYCTEYYRSIKACVRLNQFQDHDMPLSELYMSRRTQFQIFSIPMLWFFISLLRTPLLVRTSSNYMFMEDQLQSKQF